MTKMVSGLFGAKTAIQPAPQETANVQAISDSQAQQRAELDAEKKRLARVEEGRANLRSSRRGLLAFIDDAGLSSTLGGGR